MTNLTASQFALLSTIAAATAASGMMYLSPSEDAQVLLSANLIEVNTGVTDDKGQAQSRATEAGMSLVRSQATSGSAQMGAQNPATGDNKPTFERVRLSALPPKPERKTPEGFGNREETYPFSELLPAIKNADGSPSWDGVFVPASDKMKNPAKSLLSATSAATRRYATVTGEKTGKTGKVTKTYKRDRVFEVRPSQDANKPGAWIIRTDDGNGNIVS